MQEYNVIIKIKNEFFTERVTEDTRFVSLAEKYQSYYKDKIVLVSVNNGLKELNNVVDRIIKHEEEFVDSLKTFL